MYGENRMTVSAPIRLGDILIGKYRVERVLGQGEARAQCSAALDRLLPIESWAKTPIAST
jgi:hypothetical protein